jgi:hypothetical protein
VRISYPDLSPACKEQKRERERERENRHLQVTVEILLRCDYTVTEYEITCD